MKKKSESSFVFNIDGVQYINEIRKEDTGALKIVKPADRATCKFCDSTNVVKYGHSKGVQCLWCKDCHRKFADNKAPPGMKIPGEQINYVLSMYLEGMGLKAIRRYLQHTYNSYPSDSTVYGWIDLFVKKIITAARKNIPRVGDKWIVISTQLKIGNENVWFWDILDIRTRYFLATHVSKKLTTRDARFTLDHAIKAAAKLPAAVLADQSIVDLFQSLEISFNGDPKCISARKVLNAADRQLLENYRSTLNARTLVLKGFKNLKNARKIIRGWPVHYNYLRPYEITANNTPAYLAGINSQLKIKLP